VSEARNLKGLKGDVARGEMPDPYCILTVESSFARTRTVSKNSSPLWTEEFHLYTLHTTHTLSFSHSHSHSLLSFLFIFIVDVTVLSNDINTFCYVSMR
jgi:Ca2+-dependent lipid-binding protein